MSNFIKDWTEKEIVLLNRSFRRYSSLIRVLKYLLPVIIGLLVIMLVVFLIMGDGAESIKIEPIKIDKQTDLPKMQNPRFHGVDGKNQPYNIFAETALQKSKDEVMLEDINADITLEDGSWISMVAAEGYYSIKNEFLQLRRDVAFFITDYNLSGYEIETTAAEVDVRKKLVVGKQPISVRSDIGNFTAQSFTANLAEQRIFFNGPIKLVITR